jgi:hypothetical protein
MNYLMMCIDELFNDVIEDIWFKDVLIEVVWFKDVLYKDVLLEDEWFRDVLYYDADMRWIIYMLRILLSLI